MVDNSEVGNSELGDQTFVLWYCLSTRNTWHINNTYFISVEPSNASSVPELMYKQRHTLRDAALAMEKSNSTLGRSSLTSMFSLIEKRPFTSITSLILMAGMKGTFLLVSNPTY